MKKYFSSIARNVLSFFLEPETNTLSMKRLIAFMMALALIRLVFYYETHSHFEFTLVVFEEIILGILGVTVTKQIVDSYNSRQAKKNDENLPRN